MTGIKQKIGVGEKKSPLFLCAFVSFFVFFSCSSVKMDIIQTGPWFPSKKVSEVRILNDRNKAEKPFGGIAIIHSDPFSYSGDEVKKNLERAVKKAAAIGADAVVYSVGYYDENASLGEKGKCYLTVLAIKYADQNEKKP